jgi:hypothetical protein
VIAAFLRHGSNLALLLLIGALTAAFLAFAFFVSEYTTVFTP